MPRQELMRHPPSLWCCRLSGQKGICLPNPESWKFMILLQIIKVY